MRREETGRSAVAEHALQSKDHRIKVDTTLLLAATSKWYKRLYREPIEIVKKPRIYWRRRLLKWITSAEEVFIIFHHSTLATTTDNGEWVLNIQNM